MVSAAFRSGVLTLVLILAAPFAAASGVPVHRALDDWLRDGGLAGAEYRARGIPERPADWPGWLLRPAGRDALNLFFLDRGLPPEAATLDWRSGHGVVAIFGRKGPAAGPRLVVDRDRQRPLALHLPDGTAWHLRDYTAVEGRRTGLPDAVVRVGPEGEETAFRRVE